MKKACTTALLMLTICVSTSLSAEGIRYKPETVAERERPELAPLGAHAGSHRLYPRLTLSSRYEDNIFATNNDTVSDLITMVRPGIAMQSLWERHTFDVFADATLAYHADNKTEDFQDFNAGFYGNIELNHEQNISINYQFTHGHESRSSADDVFGLEPSEFNEHNVSLNYQRRINRLVFDLNGQYEQISYKKVLARGQNPISNSDRDRNRVQGGIKIGYEYLPEYIAYVSASLNNVDYHKERDDNGFNRDSDGYRLTAGTDLDLSGVLYGNAYIGYRSQQFDDLLLKNVQGLIGGASLTWLPSQLTTITSSVSRSIEETTLDAASASFLTNADISIDHELLRNFLLQGRFNIADQDFEGIDRRDRYLGAGLGATYMLNRHLYLLLDYDYQQRDSDSVTNIDDFTDNQFTFSGKFQL